MPIPLKGITHAEESIWGSDFKISSKESVLLNASSGKGKSTFTSIVCGLRNDFEGNLTINQRDAQQFDDDFLSHLRTYELAVVFQDLQLFPELTVAENLQLKNQLTQTFTEQELLSMLEELGIPDKWTQKVGLLSMGQKQRVAIIRALAQPFKILILDEPFSHLDQENTLKCLALIRRRCEELNAGFVLTTLGDTYDGNFSRELKL